VFVRPPIKPGAGRIKGLAVGDFKLRIEVLRDRSSMTTRSTSRPPLLTKCHRSRLLPLSWLAKMLIKTATPKKFDLAKYEDVYTQKLTKLIEAKVAGQEIVAAPAQETRPGHQPDGSPQAKRGQSPRGC
jgi:hypothetical protein